METFREKGLFCIRGTWSKITAHSTWKHANSCSEMIQQSFFSFNSVTLTKQLLQFNFFSVMVQQGDLRRLSIHFFWEARCTISLVKKHFEKSLLLALRTCCRLSVQCLCSVLGLFLYLWESFQAEAASDSTGNTSVSPNTLRISSKLNESKGISSWGPLHFISRHSQVDMTAAVSRCKPYGATFKMSVLHIPVRSMPAEVFNPSYPSIY